MTYALLANPKKHFYSFRRKKIDKIILHVTAGLEDLGMNDADHSAENTNNYGATTTTVASWHKCVDSDSIADALPDEYTAFHCINYNSPSLGLEISNSDARWDNKPQKWVDATLLNAAKVCLAWEKKYSIPRRLLSKAQVDAGMSGYSYHMFLDPTRRHDPGPTFPWAHFVQILESLDAGKPVTPYIPAPAPTWKVEDLVFPTLKRGSQGQPVRCVQGLLLAAGRKVDLDGDFGPGTEKVLREWQSSVNHNVTGVVEPGTWRRLLGV